MAFSLTGIGTGIGGFMGGFQQAQQYALQRQALQNQLQQQQKEQQARALITQALGSQPAAGFSGGITGLPGGSAPQPPMPGQPSMPAAPQQPMMPPPGQQPQPQAPSPYYPQLSNPTQMTVTPQPQQPAGDPNALPTPQQEAQVENDVMASSRMGEADAQQPPGGNTPAATGSPAPLGDTGAGGATQPEPPAPPPQVMSSAQPGQFIATDPKTGQAFNLSSLLHPESFGDIVQKIKKARPDADDETVEMAAEKLYTLANQGDKVQQLGAMATLKYLGYQINTASRENIAAANIASRERNVDIQQQGANTRAAAGNTSRENIADKRIAAGENRTKMIQDRIDERFRQQMAQRKLTTEQRTQAQMVANSYKNIMTQLAAVKAQIPYTGASAQQQQQLQALQDQAVKLYAQLKGMGLAVDTPATLLGNGAASAPAK